jgi:hypothetical protein
VARSCDGGPVVAARLLAFAMCQRYDAINDVFFRSIINCARNSLVLSFPRLGQLADFFLNRFGNSKPWRLMSPKMSFSAPILRFLPSRFFLCWTQAQ